ncbi:MAG: outer membrane protein assembly factor BamE [Bacteroidales bacterium]|nr:outer membrane protein assembly factor BamE [Bacteroidales bacterium]
MTDKLKEIKLGYGLGLLKFGMTRKEVEELLGKPDETEQYNYADDINTEAWHYDEHEFSVSFDEEEDWRLITIAISSEDCEFRGKKLIGMSQDETIAQIKELNIKDFEIEDCSTDDYPNHELIAVDELCINFWFDEGMLSEIQWGPFYLDDDNVDWPN